MWETSRVSYALLLITNVCVCVTGGGLTVVGGQDLGLLYEGRGLLPQGAPPLKAPPLRAPLHVCKPLHCQHQLLLVAWRTHAVCEVCVFVRCVCL